MRENRKKSVKRVWESLTTATQHLIAKEELNLEPEKSSASVQRECNKVSFFLSFVPDYNEASSRRRSEDFSPTGTKEEWELNKANSLRFRSSHHHPKAKHNSAHHHKHHAHHVMKAEQLHVSAGSSISNQNIHNVDSIEILPIFHKLLEDKRSSDCAFNNSATQDSHSHYHHHVTASAASSSDHPHSKNRFHSARSCPDMSVRCDIVEYLWISLTAAESTSFPTKNFILW